MPPHCCHSEACAATFEIRAANVARENTALIVGFGNTSWLDIRYSKTVANNSFSRARLFYTSTSSLLNAKMDPSPKSGEHLTF